MPILGADSVPAGEAQAGASMTAAGLTGWGLFARERRRDPQRGDRRRLEKALAQLVLCVSSNG